MSLLAAIPIIGSIVDKVLGIVGKVIPDKDLAAKLSAEIQQQLLQLDYSIIEKELTTKAQVLTAEITGQSWLQRNWRPILMLVIITIVANNYLIYPYLKLFGIQAMPLDLPERLWDLMTLGVGGYVAGRSAEKVMQVYKTGKISKETE